MSNTKKYIIGLFVVSLIIAIIIWYRNYQKNNEIALAKTKLIGSGVTTSPTNTSDIGKTLVVKNISADLLDIDTLGISYTKYGIGAFVGDIVADKTNEGNTSFYKVINSVGAYYYVLKTSTKII